MKKTKVAPASAVEFLLGTITGTGAFKKVAPASAVDVLTGIGTDTSGFKKLTKVAPQEVEISTETYIRASSIEDSYK